jgi:hypothetical protein
MHMSELQLAASLTASLATAAEHLATIAVTAAVQGMRHEPQRKQQSGCHRCPLNTKTFTLVL